MAHTHGAWQEVSAPCHMSLSGFLGVSMSLQMASPRKRDIKRMRGRSHSVFYNLPLEVTHHRFYHILLFTETNPGSVWEGVSQGYKYQELGIIVGPSQWLATITYKFLWEQNFFKETENMAPIFEHVLLIYFIPLSGF